MTNNTTCTCPRCQQGTVIKAKVLGDGATISICNECEALWPKDKPIKKTNFISFKEYMTKKGYRARWNEIKVI